MKYFLKEAERKESGSTCYFEFQEGRYQEEHWLNNSICIHADKFDALDLYHLFSKSIGAFAYFGLTEVKEEQWMCLVKNSAGNEKWKEIIAECTPWVEACFQKYDYFTICGI